MARDRFNQRTLLNIAAVAILLMIVLAIGVFIGKSLTITSSPDNPSAGPTITVAPSAIPTYSPSLAPTLIPTWTPTPSSATPTITATPTVTITPTATATVTATPTVSPTPTPTAYPTQPPQVTHTPTPTPAPTPGDLIPDGPFHESITPIKTGDFLPPVSDQNSYDPGNGPIFIDMSNSNMGSPWAYPGDTLGIGLKLNNNGPAIDTYAKVTMSLKKMVITDYGQVLWVDYPVTKQFSTHIQMSDHGTMIKNISYTIPTDIPGIEGTYKISIKFYLNDQYSAGVVKVVTIL